MKLKSKQTGEIMKFDVILVAKDVKGNEVAHLEYGSIKDFTDHWEDAPEELKGTYFIDPQGDVQFWDSSSLAYPGGWTKEKEIGNYFSSREEAEKAVEKLKAWKRLKDKGFRFKESNTCGSDFSVCFSLEDHDDYLGSIKDFDKCFGGEE